MHVYLLALGFSAVPGLRLYGLFEHLYRAEHPTHPGRALDLVPSLRTGRSAGVSTVLNVPNPVNYSVSPLAKQRVASLLGSS